MKAQKEERVEEVYVGRNEARTKQSSTHHQDHSTQVKAHGLPREKPQRRYFPEKPKTFPPRVTFTAISNTQHILGLKASSGVEVCS